MSSTECFGGDGDQSSSKHRNGEICAIILEPVVENGGFIAPKPEAVRKIIKENNALLISGEVMTRFCLSYGGAQEHFGITPDLTALGKIIGGGLPVGAYGGKGVNLFKAFIIDAGKKTGRAIRGGYIRGMFGYFFTEGLVYNLADAKKSYTAKFARIFKEC
ncbi:GLUTAMATE-1-SEMIALDEHYDE 21-AMINOMUTASE [Salix viminalis]|uniref:GLUTAMATE-1-SEMIALDEHYDE 21-AMINOMUTASE n=1 Tax=Salix viminalis TaxID=40686 RepID=A0A9Q0NM11_SALVM|nr:GLUTAMATE-1-SEMIALDEHYDE 21-AMINOMUTASE [Salix viminalis]